MKPQSIGELLRQATEILAARPVYDHWPHEERMHQNRYEAEQLLTFASGQSRKQWLLHAEERLPDGLYTTFSQAVQQRLAGMPLAYITGTADFYGRTFHVDARCLIPRPDTEVLVEAAVHWLRKYCPHGHVYDLGCGSGAISISVALECPHCSVEAVEISKDALQVAVHNAQRLQASVQFRHVDGLQDLQDRAKAEVCRASLSSHTPIHVLLSNPPYIPSADISLLDEEVQQYEPHSALDGGVDGLDFYRAMLRIGPAIFVSEGPVALFWELGIGEADLLFQECANVEIAHRWQDWHFWTIPDLRGIPRVWAGERIRTMENEDFNRKQK